MLTNEQIAFLDQFCEQKDVHYYDLRMELTDHLAESIENKISENPALSFDTALTAVYQSFGKNGFSDLVGERRAALIQARKKAYRKEIRHYFEWPRILSSTALLVVAFIPTFFFTGCGCPVCLFIMCAAITFVDPFFAIAVYPAQV